MNEAPTIPTAPAAPSMPVSAMPTTPPPAAPAAPAEVPTSYVSGGSVSGNGYPQSQLKVVGRVNFPATQLFEATGFIDESKEFPTANAFLMFVPGVPDQSKMSGRTYNQEAREIMKVSNRDLYALADALQYAATYGQCDFTVFTDSSKFSGTAQGAGQTKQVAVGTAQGNNGKIKIFLNYKGHGKITLALEKWHAVGLAGQLKQLADSTQAMKFQHDQKHNA